MQNDENVSHKGKAEKIDCSCRKLPNKSSRSIATLIKLMRKMLLIVVLTMTIFTGYYRDGLKRGYNFKNYLLSDGGGACDGVY